MNTTKTEMKKSILLANIARSFVTPSDECGSAAVSGLLLYAIENDYLIDIIYDNIMNSAGNSTLWDYTNHVDYDDFKMLFDVDLREKSFVFYENYYEQRQCELS